MIDSTAAPVATFGISSWVAYQLSMIREGYSAAGVSVEAGEVPGAFALFLQSIPFNMYCLFAVVMVGIIVFSGRDFGEMLDAEHRPRRGEAPAGRGDSDAKRRRQPRRGAHRLAAAPVLRCADPLADGGRGRRRAYTGLGGSEPGASVFEIAGNAAFVDALLWGTFTMVAVALVMGVGSGIANLDEAMETVIDGFSMMLTALTILVMAWTIGSVTTALGTGIYVTNIAENFVTPTLLPVVVLVASAFIAFSTGTSWGTMAIVTPIAVPLAWSVGGATPALLPVAIGTVFSGAIFGDHCSPISPTRRSSRRRSPVPTTSITSAPR